MNNTAIQVTDNELALINAIATSDYADGPNSTVWAQYELLPTLPYNRTSHPGVMSSLVKKGLAVCNNDSRKQNGYSEATVYLTSEGMQIASK